MSERSADESRFDGLSQEADPEDRFFGLVLEQFHLPLRVFGEMARDRADHVGANAGQLFPRGILIGQFGAMALHAAVAAAPDAEIVQRHGRNRLQPSTSLSPQSKRCSIAGRGC